MIDRPKFPRGTVIRRRVEGPPVMSEADHFIRCEACGGIIDMRDLAWIRDHEPDAPWPHRACDQVQ
jgi:hypothetical protein